MGVWIIASILIPLVAALVLLGARGASREFVRTFALAASIAALVCTLVLAYQFVQLPAAADQRESPVEARYVTAYPWFSYGNSSTNNADAPSMRFDFLL